MQQSHVTNTASRDHMQQSHVSKAAVPCDQMPQSHVTNAAAFMSLILAASGAEQRLHTTHCRVLASVIPYEPCVGSWLRLPLLVGRSM
jgi:hypothetical protein